MFTVKYKNYYTGEPEVQTYHGNTNFENLDNKIFCLWQNYWQTVEIQIFDGEKLVRTYPKVHKWHGDVN